MICIAIGIIILFRVGNVVVEERTSVAGTVEYDLYSFCDIPVQKISGNIEGSHVTGSGSISGNIFTYDTLSYWYDNGTGNLCFNSARADDSELVPIEEGETPFVRIVTYYTQQVRINKASGKEFVSNESWWDKYEFHIPIEIR